MTDTAFEMASVLVMRKTDLADERAVIRTLIDARFSSGEIMSLADEATCIAAETLSSSDKLPDEAES